MIFIIYRLQIKPITTGRFMRHMIGKYEFIDQFLIGDFGLKRRSRKLSIVIKKRKESSIDNKS